MLPPIEPFSSDDAASLLDWRQLIASIEDELVLCAPPGRLAAGHALYLHKRTNGSIGSLGHLLRLGAVEAILNGTESFAKKRLEQIKIDSLAEQ